MLLSSYEQKMSNTMIVADFIHLAETKESVVAVVSSDDDLAAGIITAMLKGTHIIHVSTAIKPIASSYINGLTGNYTCIGL